MFLRKLYSEPLGLLHPEQIVTFKDGVNFIFGKKDNSSDSKDSLNGIGKSMLLDLVDFCLLSSTTPRLKLAKENEITNDYKVVLEFEINNEFYILKRSINNPNKDIEFGKIDDTKLYTSSELREILCDFLFKNPNYKGKYFNTWLRKLLPFFIKIQPPKKEKFVDPIQYLSELKPMELYQYHLFLMGIDNTIVYRNFELQSYLKEKEPVIDSIERFIQERYGFKNVDDASNEVDSITSSIKNLEEAISEFKLAKEYADIEKDANQLTESIKNLWYLNFSDRKKIERYKESFTQEVSLDTKRIQKIYGEVNELLSQKIKVTLDEAIAFRENLSKSRKEFLEGEISSLQKSIEGRETEISTLESKRAKLFKFLSMKEAIKDLSEAYLQLSQKRETLNELEGKIRLYNDFVKEKAELKTESASLFTEILTFLETIKQQITDFRRIFTSIYNAIYIENKDESKFTVGANEKTDAKLYINVSFPADLSKGKNQGRTLVYDLAMLFHAIDKKINCPRFLIHDGIFDGMYKGQFVHLYEYLTSLEKTVRFQYIITLNEEGTLDDRFGKVDKLNSEEISKEAIVTLTPSTKLLGSDF